MIYAGINVAKDKHDCIIVDSNGNDLSKVFTIPNARQGFDELFANLKTHSKDLSNLKVGLEATGHYSDNLLEFLIANDLPTTVINPLHTNLYRKGLSLRKTKTDKVDAHSIVTMLPPHMQKWLSVAQNICAMHYLMLQSMSAIGTKASVSIWLRNVLRVNHTT